MLKARAHVHAHVLVAEDDMEMRRLVAEALRKDGHDVEEVVDGSRLLVAISQRLLRDLPPVDLIVSDIRMPVCTGLEIVEALRGAHIHTPVILMTAFGDAATRARAESSGAVLFDKPFEIEDLRRTVRGVLARRHATP